MRSGSGRSGFAVYRLSRYRPLGRRTWGLVAPYPLPNWHAPLRNAAHPKGAGGPARHLRVRYGLTDSYDFTSNTFIVMTQNYRYGINHTSPGTLQPAEPTRQLKISSSSKPNHRPKEHGDKSMEVERFHRPCGKLKIMAVRKKKNARKKRATPRTLAAFDV